MASYHPTESIMYGLLNSSELAKTEWFLSLRAVTQKSADFFTKDPEGIFDHYDPKLLGSEPRPYLSKDYRSLYNLISAREKWDSATLLFESFVVSFFVRCLKRAGYISEKDTNETSDEEMKIGKLITVLTQSLAIPESLGECRSGPFPLDGDLHLEFVRGWAVHGVALPTLECRRFA